MRFFPPESLSPAKILAAVCLLASFGTVWAQVGYFDALSEKHGNIAYKLATGELKGPMSRITGHWAESASLEGIRLIHEPEGDFVKTYERAFNHRRPADSPGVSPDYEVTIIQNGRRHLAPVYEEMAVFEEGYSQGVGPFSDTEHFVNYTHRGAIEIEVSILPAAPPATDIQLFPSRYGLKPVTKNDGRIVSVTIDRPEYLVMVINSNFRRPLFLFGNPAETPAPDPTDPAVLRIRPTDDFNNAEARKSIKDYRVVYFDEGYHEIGRQFPIYGGQTAYFHGGAYVVGTLVGGNPTFEKVTNYGMRFPVDSKKTFNDPDFRKHNDLSKFVFCDLRKGPLYTAEPGNITIRGRGILSGRNYDWRTGDLDYRLLWFGLHPEGDYILEGLTFAGRRTHSPRVWSNEKTRAENVKIICGLNANTDGFQWGYNNRYLKNGFISAKDDGMYTFVGQELDKVIFYHRNNAHSFQIGRKAEGKKGHNYYHNITVIDGHYGAHGLTYTPNAYMGAVMITKIRNKNVKPDQQMYGSFDDYAFKNFYFETGIVNIFFLGTRLLPGEGVRGMVFRDWYFENVVCPYGQAIKNSLHSRKDSADMFKNFTFKDILWRGQRVTDLDEFVEIAEPGMAENITIE